MAKFCGECGAKLKDENAKVCVQCGSDPSRPTKFCVHCGKQKKSENAVACLSCGASLGSGKDPGIAALIAVVGFLLLGAPALGYFYIGNVRKGLIYLIGSWVFVIAIVVFYLIAGYATLGIGLCCFLPLIFVPLVLDIAIIYDVYLVAKGEKPKLPEF